VSSLEVPMRLRVEATAAGHRLAGDGVDVALMDRFLEHLSARNFAAANDVFGGVRADV